MNLFLHTMPNVGYQILSLALDEETREDLIKDGLDFLYVTTDSLELLPAGICLSKDPHEFEKLFDCNNFDVFELLTSGVLRQIYDNASIDNVFFITAKCNSNCIFCPSASGIRKKGTIPSVDRFIEIARHIPVSMRHLTITGGEPFLLGEQIFDLFAFLKKKYYSTEFLVLTNGRALAIRGYPELVKQNVPPNTIFGIPLHGSSAKTHDAITRAPGSFNQTLSGIKSLLRQGQRVELRLVVSKNNISDFLPMAELISRELSGVEYISIMAMEMTGNARSNLEDVWIPYREAFQQIEAAIMHLIYNGLTVRLYNFPLCVIKEQYHPLCEKSISPDKIRYAEKCSQCVLRDACGGVFAGTFSLEESELQPKL